jgi:hypothetical protein
MMYLKLSHVQPYVINFLTDGEHKSTGRLMVLIVSPVAAVLLLVLVIDIHLRLKILAYLAGEFQNLL